MLLDRGKIDPDAKKTGRETTPLWLAVTQNHLSVVQYLLATGKVNPNPRNTLFSPAYGQTPLVSAITLGACCFQR